MLCWTDIRLGGRTHACSENGPGSSPSSIGSAAARINEAAYVDVHGLARLKDVRQRLGTHARTTIRGHDGARSPQTIASELHSLQQKSTRFPTGHPVDRLLRHAVEAPGDRRIVLLFLHGIRRRSARGTATSATTADWELSLRLHRSTESETTTGLGARRRRGGTHASPRGLTTGPVGSSGGTLRRRVVARASAGERRLDEASLEKRTRAGAATRWRWRVGEQPTARGRTT